MIIATENNIWRSQVIVEGDVYPEMEESEEKKLVRIGKAKYVPMPTANDTVKEIKEYMDNHGIEYDSTMLKDDLLEAIHGD